jgi:hypothetical protein
VTSETVISKKKVEKMISAYTLAWNLEASKLEHHAAAARWSLPHWAWSPDGPGEWPSGHRWPMAAAVARAGVPCPWRLTAAGYASDKLARSALQLGG